MKEKIKNFLLKIKKSLCTEIKTPVYKIMLFGLIMIVLSCISFSCANFVTNTLNDMQTEQIEETPQAESIRIDRDIKGDNSTRDIYVNPSNSYGAIYFNYTLDNNIIIDTLNQLTFINLSSFGMPSTNVYPIYCCTDGNSINFLWFEYISISHYDLVSAFMPSMNFNYLGSVTSSVVTNYDYNVLPKVFITPYNVVLSSYQGFSIGAQNQLLSNIVSPVYFESSSTPTLENAPTELVNTIPTNAVTTLPSNLGTKVYDSGSNTYNNNNVFGYQLYYNNLSSFRFDNDSTLVNNLSVQFDNFYYQYTINEIYLVLYGLWNNTQIYYISDNLVDVSRSFYTKDYENFNFTNTLNTTNTINSLYSDFSHIYVDVSLLMQSIYTVNNNTVDIASYSDYGFEFLLPSSINSFEYGNKSHDLDIVCELDRNFVELFNLSKNMTLNDIKSNTFNEVYDSAFNSGSESGYNEGYDSGYDLGFSNGRLEGYETGYNEGFEIGTIDGYETGYIDGNNAGISSQAPFNPVMDFIADGALVISNVFSFEILPNLTLGTLLLFPLVISLIWFIIKLFMGG